jgi:DNA-binding transcriptional ArsR family regulator
LLFSPEGCATWLRIVGRLCEGGPASIARLTDGTAVSRQAVTKHLHALEEAGLVRSHRAGRERMWELRSARLEEARRHLERISQEWDGAIERVRALVEKG